MSELADQVVWSAVERRLAGVEAYIPDAPPWASSTITRVRSDGPRFVTTRPIVRPRRRVPLRLAWALIAAVLTLLVGLLIAGALRESDAVDADWGPLGTLRQGDGAARAALLPDGRVIVVSGEWVGMGNPRARADVWDPQHGFEIIDAPTIPRVDPTTTLLADGRRVLVVGGYGRTFAYPSSAIASAEIWDLDTETFQTTGAMSAARVGHTATVLLDGRVLIVGGAGPDGGAAGAEVFDPGTGDFHPAGRLAQARTGHAATLLLDGRVLIAGGSDPTTGLGVATVEVWDPATGQSTPVMTLLDAPDSVELTRLPSGSVLMTGAAVLPGGMRGALLWDPRVAGTQLLEMGQARSGHSATLLSDGRVLVIGGRTSNGPLVSSVEIWDPRDGAFHDAFPAARGVADHTAVLLADGQVLVVPATSGPTTGPPFLYQPGIVR
jgi:hypothetical protein